MLILLFKDRPIATLLYLIVAVIMLILCAVIDHRATKGCTKKKDNGPT